MAKTNYSVKYDEQVFTRSTDRVYTHVVIARAEGCAYEAEGWSGRIDLAIKVYDDATQWNHTDVVLILVETNEVIHEYHVDAKVAEIAKARRYVRNAENDLAKVLKATGRGSSATREMRVNVERNQAALDALLAKG